MKIAIIYHWFAHYRKPVIREITEELSSEHSFDFLADDTSLEPAMEVMSSDDFSEIFEKHENCEFVKIRNRGLAGFIWQSGVIRRMLTQRYDIVIFLGELRILSTWIAIIIARLRGARVFYWSHGVYGNESWLTMKVRLFFYRLADGMFLYGNYSRNLLISRGFDPRSLYVIYNSLDHQRQVELRHSLGKEQIALMRRQLFPGSDADPIVIFVGRITTTKKLDLLLDAFEKVNKRKAANLLVVGDGPNLSVLKDIAKKSVCRDRIQFKGPCHDEKQLSEYFMVADVCVSPGNVGLLAMHSLVYGTPVITHNVKSLQMPEFEAIIEGRTGGFFAIDDVSSLERTLFDWLTRVDADRDSLREDCFAVIDRVYNPSYQCQVFRNVFSGQAPPNELVRLSNSNLVASNAQETAKKS